MEEDEYQNFGTNDDRTADERLQERFPHAPTSAVQLLAQMLRYSPAERPRASECICEGPRHEFRDMLPRPHSARLAPPVNRRGYQMSFPFENERQDRRSLRQLILGEVDAEPPSPTPSSLAVSPVPSMSASRHGYAEHSSSDSYDSDNTEESDNEVDVSYRSGSNVAWRRRSAAALSGAGAGTRTIARRRRDRATEWGRGKLDGYSERA